MTCAPSSDSDQPGHPPCLIRDFAMHMKKLWITGYPKSTQQRVYQTGWMPRLTLQPSTWGHQKCNAWRQYDDFDVIITSVFAKRFDVNMYERSRTKRFLNKKCKNFSIKLIKQHILKSKCNCRRKSMQAFWSEQLPSWWNFQSVPHNH